MIDTVTSIADHASVQSDRWMFVAVIVCSGAVGIFAARWLASRYEAMLSTWREDMRGMQIEIGKLHSERIVASDAHATELRTLLSTQAADAKAMLREFAGIIAKNAEVLGGVTTALNDLKVNCNRNAKHSAP